MDAQLVLHLHEHAAGLKHLGGEILRYLRGGGYGVARHETAVRREGRYRAGLVALHQLVAGVVEFLDSHSFFNASFRVKMKIRQKSRSRAADRGRFLWRSLPDAYIFRHAGDRAADIWRAICFFRPSTGFLSCQFSVRTPKPGQNLMHSQPTSVTAIITSALFTRPFLNMYLGSSPWPMGMALMEVGNV